MSIQCFHNVTYEAVSTMFTQCFHNVTPKIQSKSNIIVTLKIFPKSFYSL